MLTELRNAAGRATYRAVVDASYSVARTIKAGFSPAQHTAERTDARLAYDEAVNAHEEAMAVRDTHKLTLYLGTCVAACGVFLLGASLLSVPLGVLLVFGGGVLCVNSGRGWLQQRGDVGRAATLRRDAYAEYQAVKAAEATAKLRRNELHAPKPWAGLLPPAPAVIIDGEQFHDACATPAEYRRKYEPSWRDRLGSLTRKP